MRSTEAWLSFSIDLELDVNRQSVALERRLDALTIELLELFDEYSIPATWAVADPAFSAATGIIQESPLKHEFAILAERAWAGVGAGRLRFLRELRRRVTGARSIGLNVRTLAMRNVDGCNDADRWAESGIQVVRWGEPIGIGLVSDPTAPANSRYENLTTWHFPRSTKCHWWGWETRDLKRNFSVNLSQNSAVHLAIDAARVLEDANTALCYLENILQFAAQQRAQGDVKIVQLLDLAPIKTTKLCPAFRSTSESILRPAA